jgi:hypothetical protein
MSKQAIPVYQIDSGVPIPIGKYTRIPLYDLEVGDSFLFPFAKRSSVQSLASRIKRDTGKEYTIKKMDSENCRVWRTK